MSKERSEAKAAIVANLGQALAARSEAIGKVTEALRLARSVVAEVENPYLQACGCGRTAIPGCPCCGGLRPLKPGPLVHRAGCGLARLKELLG